VPPLNSGAAVLYSYARIQYRTGFAIKRKVCTVGLIKKARKPTVEGMMSFFCSAHFMWTQEIPVRQLTGDELETCTAVAEHLGEIAPLYQNGRPVGSQLNRLKSHLHDLLALAVKQNVVTLHRTLDEQKISILTLPEPWRSTYLFLRFMIEDVAGGDANATADALLEDWHSRVENWNFVYNSLDRGYTQLLQTCKDETARQKAES
jgi:hypothetical protein